MATKGTVKKSYILAPDYDCSIDGPIFLGIVLPHPLKPYEPLNNNEAAAKELAKLAVQSEKSGWRMSNQNSRSIDCGIFTQLLSPLLGVGVDAGGAFSSERATDIDVDLLRTEFVRPSSDKITEVLKTSTVWEQILLKKIPPLYMVTGRKLAYGVSASESVAGEFTPSLGAVANVTQLGAPADVGARALIDDRNKRGTTFKGSSNIVLGYQVRRVHYDKRSKSFRTDAYNKHTSLSTEHGNEDNLALLEEDDDDIQVQDDSIKDIDVHGLGATNFGSAQVGKQAVIASGTDNKGALCELLSSLPR